MNTTSNGWSARPMWLGSSNTAATNTTYTYIYSYLKCGKPGRGRFVKKPTSRAYHLTDGEWFVRGVSTFEEAAAILVEQEEIRDDAPEDMDWEISRQSSNWEVGLWRFVPCSPSFCGEHAWHLVGAKKPGRGVFEGVFFTQVEVDTIEYEIDADLNDPWLEESA